MEKRVLIAVALSFLVLYGYQAFFPPPKPAVQTVAPPAVTGSPATEPAASSPAAEAESPAAPAAAALVSDAAERDIVVESDAVRAVFTNRGGVLKSWVLRRYRDHSGAPLDLVPQAVRGAPRPFTLLADDGKTSATLRTAIYKPSTDALTLGSGPATLTFDYQDAAGLAARKEFGFNPASPYVVTFKATVTEQGAPVNATVQFGPALGTGIIERSGSYNPPAQPIFYRD